MGLDKLELRRQIFHLFLGIIIMGLVYFDFLSIEILFGLFLVGLAVSFISLKFDIPLVSWFLRRFERDNVFPGRGALFFIVGCLLVLGLFNKDVALASIAILTFGDSISHLYGKHFGRLKNPLNKKKAIEGGFLGFIFGGLLASLFVPVLNAFIASFFAMIVEAVELNLNKRNVDDNLVIPLVSGVILYLLGLI